MSESEFLTHHSSLITHHCFHYFIKQHAISRDGVAATNRSVAFPIREGAARFFQNGQERSAVPDVHHSVEHNLRASRGDEHVAIAIAPGASRISALLQSLCRPTETVWLAH